MIPIREIIDGKLDGHQVWVCDLRFFEYNGGYGKKTTRDVKPTLVQVMKHPDSGTMRPDGSGNYQYFTSNLLKVNKKGDPIKSKKVPLFDTTGHRGPGTYLNCFWTKIECEAHYAEQVDTAILGLENYKKETTKEIDERIKSVRECK